MSDQRGDGVLEFFFFLVLLVLVLLFGWLVSGEKCFCLHFADELRFFYVSYEPSLDFMLCVAIEFLG